MRALQITALALLLPACGPATTQSDTQYARSIEPGEVEPKDDAERAVLARLSDLPANEPQTIEGLEVTAGEEYTAASGRVCRPVEISGAEAKLACQSNHGWVFVPGVFGGRASGT
jgi:hypothetical protein